MPTDEEDGLSQFMTKGDKQGAAEKKVTVHQSTLTPLVHWFCHIGSKE